MPGGGEDLKPGKCLKTATNPRRPVYASLGRPNAPEPMLFSDALADQTISYV
jgi:hypothetical protein